MGANMQVARPLECSLRPRLWPADAASAHSLRQPTSPCVWLSDLLGVGDLLAVAMSTVALAVARGGHDGPWHQNDAPLHVTDQFVKIESLAIHRECVERVSSSVPR